MAFLLSAGFAQAAPAYHPIDTALPQPTITLTGHDLTVDQVIAVARYGAKVELSPEARQHQEDSYGLLLEGATENIPIDGFNRQPGPANVAIFDGDPMEPENKIAIAKRLLTLFQNSAASGTGPEIDREDQVRAMMVVRANSLTYAASSPPILQMLIDFLNDRISPVIREGGEMNAIAAAMAGGGDVYYRGVRMLAQQALDEALLKPVEPFGMDDHALIDTNAYEVGQTALLLADAHQTLDWADLIYAMDLDGANAAIAPLSAPAQSNRPFKWLNWDAARILDMIKGSYLFDDDPARPRLMPDSLRLSPVRQGSAWKAWAALRDTELIQLNSSDQTPVIRLDARPRDAVELGTPEMAKYYIKGGKYGGGKRGFILPSANADPYPLTNDIASFTLALAKLNEVVALRLPAPPALPAQAADTVPSPPNETELEIAHARQALDSTEALLGADLIKAANQMDIRLKEDTKRGFGTAPAAAWAEFRKALPFQAEAALDPQANLKAVNFLKTNPIALFYPKGEPLLGNDDPIPLAQGKLRR